MNEDRFAPRRYNLCSMLTRQEYLFMRRQASEQKTPLSTLFRRAALGQLGYGDSPEARKEREVAA